MLNILIFPKYHAKNKTDIIYSTFNAIPLNTTNEQNIIEKMGVEVIRDQTDKDLVLIYSLVDNKNKNLLIFHLENTYGQFFLKSKKILSIDSIKEVESKKFSDKFIKLSKIHLSNRPLEEIEVVGLYKFYFYLLKYAVKQIPLELNSKKPDSKELNSKKLNSQIFENSYSYSFVNLTNKEIEDIQALVKEFNVENFSLWKMIRLYCTMNLLISNKDQEESFTESTRKKIIEKYKITEEHLKKFENRAILIVFGIEEFFFTQRKQLKQFFSIENSILKHQKKQTFYNQNSTIYVDYSVQEDGKVSEFKGKILSSISEELWNVIFANGPLNQDIIIGNKIYNVKRINRFFLRDSIIEAQILICPNNESEDKFSDIESLVYSCGTNNHLVEFRLREKFDGISSRSRTVSSESTDSEDQQIFNLLNSSSGKYIFAQDNSGNKKEIIVLLNIKNKEILKKNDKFIIENTPENSLMVLNIIYAILGKYLK